MLKRNWGRIVFISSESGLAVPSDMIHYATTKTAQLTISRGLAELTKGTGVTVNSVLPGPTRSEGVVDFLKSVASNPNASPQAIEAEFFATARASSLLQRMIEPEEIAKVKIKTTKAIDIIGFVDSSEIPTTFFDAPYYLGPDGAVADKPYALLRQVLQDTGKVGLAKVVLRDREDLVAVFPLENGIVLQKLRYPAEIRKMAEVPDVEKETKLDKKELTLATSLVEQMVTSFADVDTVDHYHEALRKLIDSKIKGKKVTEFEKVEDVPHLDIMTALKKSLQASSRKPMVKAEPAAKKKAALTLVKAKPVAKKRKVG